MQQGSSPHSNLLQLGLHEGARVADLGSGAGHYAHAAAAMVGREGKVYAVEVREDMLHHIKQSAHQHHRSIIEPIWGNIERAGGTGIRDEALDAAILANTLFQVEDRTGLLAELKRILKPGGKLLVIDWAGSFGGMGPRPDAVIHESAAEKLFIEGGFHKVKNLRAGPHHWGIIFTKPA